MVEVEGRKTLELEKEISDSEASTRKLGVRVRRDPLLLAILGTALGLAVVVIGFSVFWGSGPVLAQAVWYVPLVSAFVALTTLCISYLALGRYHVLRDPLSFWAGTGFATYGIGQIFYALTWPDLLPGGSSIIGQLTNTPAWVAIIDLSLLSSFLLAAVLLPIPTARRYAGGRWLWTVGLWLLIASIGFGLLVRFEAFLPLFVTGGGRFTPLQQTWVVILLSFFAAGSILSSRGYYRTGDKLAGYLAFPQLALVFISIMVLIGGKRYDLWWYVQRVILVAGHLTVLLGLLSEYVRLLRQESDGRRLLEAILENIPIGLSVTGGPPTFAIARVSRHGMEMNQRSAEELVGDPAGGHQVAWKIFQPDGISVPPAEQMPLYRASRFGEEVRNVELVMETQNGRKIPVLVSASPIRDAQGNIVAAVNTWLDISDRKRAEEILRESEAMYRAIARSIPNGGVFVVDKNLRYLIAEGSIMEKFGYSREMLEGRTISEIYDPETAAKMEARFQRVFAGETISYETEHNGHIYWTQHALLDDPLEHTIVITLDITARKQMERALSESEQRFRGIINQATAGIVSSDMEGRPVFVNQAFCRMLGYSESQLADKTIWDLTHGEDLEEDRRLYDRLIEKGIPFQLEKRFVRRDGSFLWVSVSAAPILNTLGKTQSAVSVVVDINERKRAEADLHLLNLELESRVEQRTAELQAANQALQESRGRLQILSQRLVEVQEQERLAIARELHDRVGQSLTALNLNLTIIGSQISEEAADRVSGRLSDSIKLVTEMIAIVRDVMSDLRPIVLDEYGLVAALQAYVGKFETRYGIQVEFIRSHQPIPRLGPALEMTVLRIVQEALLNIARHAQANHVLLSLECEDSTVHLVVQDNGIGLIPLEEIGAGGGHGLMIMRERAEAVGGTLSVSSPSGKGTRIEASLPFRNNGRNR